MNFWISVIAKMYIQKLDYINRIYMVSIKLFIICHKIEIKSYKSYNMIGLG